MGDLPRLTVTRPQAADVGYVKALAAAGITVDEWCTTTPGRPTVQVHEAAIEAVA